MALITISSANIYGWTGNNSNVELLIYTNGSFTSANGNIYPASIPTNPASLGTFYQVYPCTSANSILTLPAVTLDSTTDSVDNPAATYSAVFFDAGSGLQIQPFGTQQSFSLSPTPTTTTWGNIFAAGANTT